VVERSPRRLLIIDANVLIDFTSTDLSVLALVAKHLGEVHVPLPLLEEVDQLDESLCGQLGLRVVEPSPDALVRAAAVRGQLSFQDHLCLVMAKESGLTCVTNDKALRRACSEEGISRLWGLELMIELVAGGHLTADAALATARAIRVANPLHITAQIVAKFEERIRAISPRRGSAGEEPVRKA
jgi:predicted nucleic acid-binding protein